MALLDVFDSDAFSLHALTTAVEKLPYQPMMLGKMGLFQSSPITTSVAIVEEKRGKLALLPTMPRGSEQQTTQGREARIIRAVPVPHVPNWDAVLAGDLEGKRSFGSEDQTEVFSQILNDRLESMKQDHEVTHEWHRLGAIKGVVLDADGTTEVVNWFTEFGITQVNVTFDFTDNGTYDQADPVQDMKLKSMEVVRSIRDSLGAATFSGVKAFCGDDFFDSLVTHATVRRAYERWQDNAFHRDNQVETGFEFGGIEWINYRGSVNNVDFVEDDEARFFPTGTRNIFIEVPAPADFVETVNTRGQKVYAKQERMKWDKGIELHTQSNVLYMCTRPGCLVRGIGYAGQIATTT